MRALLDVNVLIALLDADHTFHGSAWEWFRRESGSGWASCPITENGCIRIMSHSAYPNHVPVLVVAGRLRDAAGHQLHEFWPDDASVLDTKAIDLGRVHSSRQLTDTYLVALALGHGGRFVTFDRSVTINAVSGATPSHLVVL